MTENRELEVLKKNLTDENQSIEFEEPRGIPRQFRERFDKSFKELYDYDIVRNAFCLPDADVAREYFDSADQLSEIEVEVELGGTTATVVGEVGYRWDVIVETPDGGLEEVLPEYDLTIEGGHVTHTDRGYFMVRYLGLWNDRSGLYECIRDLLEQVNNFDPPTHRTQAMRWQMTAEGPVPAEADDADDGRDAEQGEA